MSTIAMEWQVDGGRTLVRGRPEKRGPHMSKREGLSVMQLFKPFRMRRTCRDAYCGTRGGGRRSPSVTRSGRDGSYHMWGRMVLQGTLSPVEMQSHEKESVLHEVLISSRPVTLTAMTISRTRCPRRWTTSQSRDAGSLHVPVRTVLRRVRDRPAHMVGRFLSNYAPLQRTIIPNE